MRLIGLIIAALLVVAAGVLVISAPQAVASGGQIIQLFATDTDAHGSQVHAEMDHAHGVRSAALDHHASTQEDCGDPASGNHGRAGADCCGMGACHAVQALAAPTLHSPSTSAAIIVLVGDEQVAGITPGGLDRPPRTA
ncbi:hypothetical protein ACFOYU_05875 [Microvirga sp. GCM10011540]|uniref:hypothetical protein n=1 Tax=Microvirga sp. GCM10011540 TaxID=3317338 RepID=UPI00361F4CAF